MLLFCHCVIFNSVVSVRPQKPNPSYPANSLFVNCFVTHHFCQFAALARKTRKLILFHCWVYFSVFVYPVLFAHLKIFLHFPHAHVSITRFFVPFFCLVIFVKLRFCFFSLYIFIISTSHFFCSLFSINTYLHRRTRAFPRLSPE